jgi:FkbH-like protein
MQTITQEYEVQTDTALEPWTWVPKQVWMDFDGTIIEETLGEGEPHAQLTLRAAAVNVIRTFARVKSELLIITRNVDRGAVIQVLTDADLAQHFSMKHSAFLTRAKDRKSTAITDDLRRTNFRPEDILFVDNDETELRDVEAGVPGVHTVHIDALAARLAQGHLDAQAVTDEANMRAALTAAAELRTQLGREFVESGKGTLSAYMASLHPLITVSPAVSEDLSRLDELIRHCTQYATTAKPVSRSELEAAIPASRIPDLEICDGQNEPLLLIVTIEDDLAMRERCGFMLVNRKVDTWLLQSMAVSCRSAHRMFDGLTLGEILIGVLSDLAQHAHVDLQAEFYPTDRNEPMRLVYYDAGFYEVDWTEKRVLMTMDFARVPSIPPCVTVEVTR